MIKMFEVLKQGMTEILKEIGENHVFENVNMVKGGREAGPRVRPDSDNIMVP